MSRRRPARRSRPRSSPASSRSGSPSAPAGSGAVAQDEVGGLLDVARYVPVGAAELPREHDRERRPRRAGGRSSAACRRPASSAGTSRRASAACRTGSRARGRPRRVSPAASSAGGDLVEVARPDQVVGAGGFSMFGRPTTHGIDRRGDVARRDTSCPRARPASSPRRRRALRAPRRSRQALQPAEVGVPAGRVAVLRAAAKPRPARRGAVSAGAPSRRSRARASAAGAPRPR